MHGLLPFVTLVALCASSVYGHGLITVVSGANGVDGKGFAVIDGTPRVPGNGTEVDTSIIRDKEIKNGKVGGCGRTRAGGPTKVAAQLKAAVAAGLPTASGNGTVTMTIHQVNGDGAGPYTCEVSTDGTANKFTPMKVLQNVPGVDGRSKTKAKDFEVLAVLPKGTKCTGGPDGNACVVRCRNDAHNGPFGGCVAVALKGQAKDGKKTSDKKNNATTGNASSTVAVADASATTTSNVIDGADLADAADDIDDESAGESPSASKRFVTSRILGAHRLSAWI